MMEAAQVQRRVQRCSKGDKDTVEFYRNDRSGNWGIKKADYYIKSIQQKLSIFTNQRIVQYLQSSGTTRLRSFQHIWD